MALNNCHEFIDKIWDQEIVPTLCEYIKIPCKSPAFDPDWQANGYLAKAFQLVKAWCEKQPIRDLKIEILHLPNRTPLLFIDIPGEIDNTILFYGHLDKQPEMTGWRDDLGPWIPVLENGKLYGRGGADDGYAAFGCLTAISSLQQQQRPHARCIVLIEGSEESGSPDLPEYLEAFAERIPAPDLVICLDSGCDDYERMWGTTSLRGLVKGTLRVDVSSAGVHSGAYGGLMPSSFRIVHQLLDRLENTLTGEMRVPELSVVIPEQILQQTKATAAATGQQKINNLPLLPNVEPMTRDLTELLLNNTWRSCLEIVGIDGLPSTHTAGNVLRPYTAVAFSIRIPPTANVDKAYEAVKKILLSDPPHNAKVTLTLDHVAGGWCAPPLSPWLEQACAEASLTHFNKPAAYFGEGGSIPFMGMLGKRFPQAQFLITGVLGPHSNAHGPNEFLHVPFAKRLTACIADVVHAHYLEKK